MQEKEIEEKMQRMAMLEKSFRPLFAKAAAEKEEYAMLESEIIDWAEKEKLSVDRIFEAGVVKINPAKPALALLQGRGGSASWEEVVTKLRQLKLKRFLRLKEEPIKNRIKDEMSPENMRKIGVQIITEPSIKVEVF